MGIEFRITKGPQRASGTTPASGVVYTATQSMATKDVIPIIDFSKIEVVLQVFNLETNTASVQVYLETSMQEESDNSTAWLTVFNSGIISIPGRTFGVTAPATPTSPALLKYLHWTVVLTGPPTPRPSRRPSNSRALLVSVDLPASGSLAESPPDRGRRKNSSSSPRAPFSLRERTKCSMFVFNSWMSRSIAPTVKLPKMTAGETCTVVQALKTSHDAQPREALTKPVTRCLHRLSAACDTLGQGGNRQLRRAQAQAERKSRGSQRRVDYNACQRAWTALFDQVGVWRTTGAVRRLTPDQQAALDHVLPAGGPTFDLRKRNRALHNTGSALLGQVTSNGLDDVFVTLGGAEVLAHVQRTHADLGAALGVSSPMAAPVSQGPTVAEPLAVVQERLREYVVKVYALLDAEVEGSDAIVGALLAPLFDVAESRAQKSATAKRAKTAAKTRTKTATKSAAPTTVVTQSPTPANDVAPAQRPTGTG